MLANPGWQRPVTETEKSSVSPDGGILTPAAAGERQAAALTASSSVPLCDDARAPFANDD
jgi:hypothetical protein